MARFILKDLVKGGRWTLSVAGERFLIGRSREADVCIRDTSVSKKHCQIDRRVGGTFRFKDLGSRNGTFINELRTNSGPVEDGDELRVGNFSIVFYREDAAGAAGAEAGAGNAASAGSTPAPPMTTTPEWNSEDWEADGGEATIAMPSQATSPDAVVDEILYAPTPGAVTPGAVTPGAVTPGAVTPKSGTPKSGTPKSGTPKSGTPKSGTSKSVTPRAPRPTPESDAPASSRQFTRSRRRDRPDDGEDFAGDERPSGRRLAPAKGISSSNVVLFCLFSLAVGIGLGVLIGRSLGSSSSNDDDAQAAKTAKKTVAKKSKAGSATLTKSPTPKTDGGSSGSSSPPGDVDPSLRDLVGERADLSDREVSHRTLFRLFLDVLDRTPTRSEQASFLALSHADRWTAIRKLATKEPTTPALTTLPGTLRTLLGRLVSEKERDALMKEAEGSIAGVGAVISSSTLYGSARHSRDRSVRQRARALWVDLLDQIPTAENTDLILSALGEPSAGLQPIVRTLIHAPEAKSVFNGEDGTSPTSWADSAFLRFLLRVPSADERREAIAELDADADGWQRVLLALSLHKEYARY